MRLRISLVGWLEQLCLIELPAPILSEILRSRIVIPWQQQVRIAATAIPGLESLQGRVRLQWLKNQKRINPGLKLGN